MPKVLGGRVPGDVARARPRRPQLQPADAGRVARDDEGARDRPLRHRPVDDRQRLLGRLARPAAGGERLPRRLPGHHAAVLVPGRVVVRDAVRGVLLRPEVPPGPDAVGPRRRSTTRRADGVLRPPEHREPAHASRRSSRTPASPTRACPGVPNDKVYDEHTNPHGVRCTLQDYMVNAFGRDEHGFARRGFDNVGVQYGLKGLRDGRVSAAQFVDFNAQHRRGGHGPQHHPGAHRGRPDRARAAVPDRRDRLGEQPRQGRDHRPARPRSRRLPRRLPHLRHAGPARARTSARPRTRSCGEATRR